MATRKRFLFFSFTLAGLMLMLFSNCAKDDPDPQAVKDADGNEYITVTIGNQVWFAENLRTTKYNNGTAIPTGQNNEQWGALTTGAYAIYPHADIVGLNSNAEVLEAYGALYNWHAVNTGNLCPAGWRVPTDADWSQLIGFIDPNANPDNMMPESSIAGGKLKSASTTPSAHPRWDSPNPNATNQYGFSALPGGLRTDGGGIIFNGMAGYWWSSTEHASVSAWYRAMTWENSDVLRLGVSKQFGLSVRCVKNN